MPFAAGRLTPDPLGEKYYDISPYAYCAGDPVNAIDDGGLDIAGILDQSGVADGINAALQFSTGDYKGGILSSFAVIPAFGDLAKIGKLGSDIAILNKAISDVGGSPVVYKSFTKRNFRENLVRATGMNPKEMDAHHSIPKANRFQKYYDQAGININKPKYGTWIELHTHRSTARKYNDDWDVFFENTPNASKEEIENYAKKLMKSFYGEE